MTNRPEHRLVDIDRPDCFSGTVDGLRLWICRSPSQVWSVQVWRGHQQLVHRIILANDMDHAKQLALDYASHADGHQPPPQP